MALVPSLFTPGSLLGAGAIDPFTTLHREMNRLFDDVLRTGPVAAAGSGRSGMLLAPSMDVSETDNEVRIQAELPGVNEKEVEVSLNEDVLTLRAEKRQERKQEREGVHFSERAFGTFQRSLRLPFAVDPEQVQARFENGVLTVTLPKAKQKERSRRIQIQGAQQSQGDAQPVTAQAATGQASNGQSDTSGQTNGPADGMVAGMSASGDGAPAAG